MGIWTDDQYDDYVTANATTRADKQLVSGKGEPFDRRYPGIVVGYDPMWRWMSDNNIVNLDPKNFRYLRQAYQTAMGEFRPKVTSRLRQIMGRRTGVALIEEIADSERTVRIRPYHGKRVNAETTVAGDDSKAYARGVIMDYDDRDLPPDLGEGGGANALIRFTPDLYRGAAMATPSNAPDEVLFHELIHASRIMRGVLDDIPVDGKYDDQEEYLAVVLTNIYMSEKGQWIFAGDHKTKPVPLQGLKADYFLRNSQHVNMPPATLIDHFKWSQPKFYRALAYLPSPPKYNWVREFRLQNSGNFTM
jgi:NleD-like pathogen effector protein (putative zinc metallopeptidase)